VIATHRFRESRLELNAEWRLQTAWQVLNTLFRALCKNPQIAATLSFKNGLGIAFRLRPELAVALSHVTSRLRERE
jgi:hypothetical protein